MASPRSALYVRRYCQGIRIVSGGINRLHVSSLHLRRSLVHLHVPRPKLVAGLNLESPSSRRDVALDPEPMATVGPEIIPRRNVVEFRFSVRSGGVWALTIVGSALGEEARALANPALRHL